MPVLTDYFAQGLSADPAVWQTPPLLPGDWQPVPQSEAIDFLVRVSAAEKRLGRPTLFAAFPPRSVRRRALAFAPGCSIWQIAIDVRFATGALDVLTGPGFAASDDASANNLDGQSSDDQINLLWHDPRYEQLFPTLLHRERVPSPPHMPAFLKDFTKTDSLYASIDFTFCLLAFGSRKAGRLIPVINKEDILVNCEMGADLSRLPDDAALRPRLQGNVVSICALANRGLHRIAMTLETGNRLSLKSTHLIAPIPDIIPECCVGPVRLRMQLPPPVERTEQDSAEETSRQ